MKHEIVLGGFGGQGVKVIASLAVRGPFVGKDVGNQEAASGPESSKTGRDHIRRRSAGGP